MQDAPTMTMWLQVWCLQPRMGHLWWFWWNRFVLWTYWHCPAAQFLRQRWGRQSKSWRCGGNFGGLTTVDILHRWAPLALEAVAKFGKSAFAVPLPTMVLSTGGRGEGHRCARGEDNLLQLMVLIGTLGLWWHNDVCFLMACTSVKKYGHQMILRWCHTNSGALYTMVLSDWYGNVV